MDLQAPVPTDANREHNTSVRVIDGTGMMGFV